MKTVRVAAAVIRQDNRIFVTQRGYGKFKGGWEFPGGKIETGETNEAALHREIKEELNTEIRIEKYLGTIEYDYPDFHLSMACYMCEVVSGSLTLLEHMDAKWLGVEELETVKWLPADWDILTWIRKAMQS